MSKKMITLTSSDYKTFEVEEETIKHLTRDGCPDTSIPLPNVTGHTLSLIVTYCLAHAPSNNESYECINSWDAEFSKKLEADHATLLDVIRAATYLNMKRLLVLSCQTFAYMVKGKSPQQIRTMFNIINDYTPEEEEAIRKENQWAFE